MPRQLYVITIKHFIFCSFIFGQLHSKQAWFLRNFPSLIPYSIQFCTILKTIGAQIKQRRLGIVKTPYLHKFFIVDLTRCHTLIIVPSSLFSSHGKIFVVSDPLSKRKVFVERVDELQKLSYGQNKWIIPEITEAKQKTSLHIQNGTFCFSVLTAQFYSFLGIIRAPGANFEVFFWFLSTVSSQIPQKLFFLFNRYVYLEL